VLACAVGAQAEIIVSGDSHLLGLSLYQDIRILTAAELLAKVSKPDILKSQKYEETPAKNNNDDLRPEYDFSQLKGGVRGKYYRQATAGTNLVLIEPELSSLFPDTESVNRALRLLAETAASATGKTRRRGKAQTKRLKRSA